jgi:tRNA modification GTPase
MVRHNSFSKLRYMMLLPEDEQTITAIATAPGRAGVAVLRVSGPASIRVCEALTKQSPPPAREAALRAIRHPVSGEAIDRGLVLWFPGPRSFTGEDMLELQLHGSRAVLSAAIEAILVVPGCRVAEPGEFSRRAFENGKLDLTEIEGLADLIDAETAAQRRQALRQMDGALGRLYESWRSRLVRALAHLEAAIDFADEELPDDLAETAWRGIVPVSDEIKRHLADGGRGERLRRGLDIAIVGAPNAGKSTLLNRLAGREAAIVSARAGTTRDIIELQMDLGGYPVILADTAGLRETDDEIEREGVTRAIARAERADLTLVVIDGLERRISEQLAALIGPSSLIVINKADRFVLFQRGSLEVFQISAKEGAGIEALIAEIERRAAQLMASGADPVLTRGRHRAALEEVTQALDRARAAPSSELLAEEVRLAARSLGRITGRVDVEDLLDVIFRDFCLGK